MKPTPKPKAKATSKPSKPQSSSAPTFILLFVIGVVLVFGIKFLITPEVEVVDVEEEIVV